MPFKVDSVIPLHNYTHFINNRQILSKFVKNGNVSKMLCSEKFDRIFLYCQRGYILISIMTKFGRASLKDGQVITRCDENVTKMWRKCDENVTKMWRQCSFIKLFLLAPWLDWLVPLTPGHNSEPAIRVRVSIWPIFWLINFFLEQPEK